MSKKKGQKMHGGLIRKEDRVHKDKHGNTTVQHWDGRKDVVISVDTIHGNTAVHPPE